MEGECACRRVAGHRLCALNALFVRPEKQDLSGTTLKVSRLVWGERAKRQLRMLRNAPNRFFRGGQATMLRIPSTWPNNDRYGPTRLSRFLREHLFPKKTNLISPPVITASQGAIAPLSQEQLRVARLGEAVENSMPRSRAARQPATNCPTGSTPRPATSCRACRAPLNCRIPTASARLRAATRRYGAAARGIMAQERHYPGCLRGGCDVVLWAASPRRS